MSAQRPHEGLVAIVTGAGGGLGRAHAALLAELGAAVVVNDLGVGIDGTGTTGSPAQETCASIERAGGRALADGSDIATEEGASAVVESALSAFGRLDAVVNNAGIDDDDPFEDVSWESFRRSWEVNAGGTFLVTRAAWPHLAASGRGRVVMTTSSTGVYGAVRRAHYASAKGAVFGLMRAVALEGRDAGINVNGLAPVAYTRLAEAFAPPEARARMEAGMPVSAVAPLVAWLCHPSCDVTGRLFTAGGGRVAEIYPAETRGHRPSPLTPQEIGACIDRITDRADAFVARESNAAVSAGLASA